MPNLISLTFDLNDHNNDLGEIVNTIKKIKTLKYLEFDLSLTDSGKFKLSKLLEMGLKVLKVTSFICFRVRKIEIDSVLKYNVNGLDTV